MNETWVKAMWTRGDYAIVGDWFAAASRACLDDLPLAGHTLLDVACGTGAVALEAARRGARVTAVDLTPAMLTEARRRAQAAHLDIEWHEGSFNDLTRFGRFDHVTSAFGAMFAPDPPHVAAQLLAACHPKGTLTLAAWTPDGSFGSPPEGITRLLPALKPAIPPTTWATPEGLTAYFAALPARIESLRRDTIAIPFPSVESALEAMLRYSGPWQMMFEALGPAHTEARAILTDHLTRFARPRHATTLDATPATPPMPPPLPPPAASTSMPPMPSPASAPPDHAHPSLECHPGGIYLDATYAIARIRPT